MTSFAATEGVHVGLAERSAPLRPSCCSSCSRPASILPNPDFASLKTASVVLADAPVLFILAAGLTFVIMLGGIDLSVQAAASFASMVVAELLPRVGYAAFPITILVGLAMGLASGFVHVKLRIPSFVATLATAGIMTGLSLLMEGGRTVSLTDEGREQVAWISGAWLFGVPNVILIAIVVAIGGMLGAALHPVRTL